jgi:hypothetical protein
VKWQLVNVNAIAHKPEFQLFEPNLPATLELAHPLTIGRIIWHIYDNSYKVIPVCYALMPPMAFYFLRFVAGSPEIVGDFENSLRKPFWWDRFAIVKLKRKQYLEAPPFAAHTWPYPKP